MEFLASSLMHGKISVNQKYLTVGNVLMFLGVPKQIMKDECSKS